MSVQSSKFQNREFWREHIIRWEQSETTKSQYCRKNRLNYKSFLYQTRSGQINKEMFMPIELPVLPAIDDKIINNCCTVEINGGHRLIVHDKEVLPVIMEYFIRIKALL